MVYSLAIAMHDLSLDQLMVVDPGNRPYALTEHAQFISLAEYLKPH